MIRRILPILAATAFADLAHASADTIVTFNEIQYNPAGISEAGEYVELFNQLGIKVDISGWRIDGIGYTFPANTIVNPGAYVVVAKTPLVGQFGPFTGNIGNDGQKLRLINQSDRMMDEISYGDDYPWPPGADGSGFTLAKKLPYTDSGRHANWALSLQQNGTPGTVNFPSSGPPPVTTVNLFNLNNTWRYNQKGPGFDATWATTAHAVGGTGVNTWASGPGALAYETSATVPIGTTLTFPGLNSPYVMTYYFETEFSITPTQLANLSMLKLKHALDDGAVIYINGVEATRVNMPAGAFTSATAATTNVEAGTALSAYVPLPGTALVAGTNRLSVEVHQFASGNSDIVWGAQLDMDVSDPVPGAAPLLRINEIPGAAETAWWTEIVNAGAAPVDLTGVVVSIGGDAAREYVIPSGTLAGGGLLVLDQDTLGIRPADGEKLFLYTAGKTALIDARQQTGRLRGRAAQRGGEWAYPTAATPGAANTFVFTDSVVISEIQYNPPAIAPVAVVPPTFQNDPLVAYGDAWRYNAGDENLPADWAITAHAVGGNWKSGNGPIGVETAVLPVPLVTTITPYVAATVTYYFEKEFNVTPQQLATATSLTLTHEIDDGAIFYLNGTEISTARFGMPAGAVGPETLASVSVGDAAITTLTLPTTGLIVGTNRISVEVHQSSTGSSDMVFGMKLDASVQLTPGTPAQPLTNSNNQWLELTNRSASTVDLSGWDFEDGISFTFAPGTTLAPGERACLVRDAALFSAAFPTARVLGTFGGSMSRSGEDIVLRDASRNTADEVRYFDSGAWPEFGDGGGASIELRDLDADNMQGGAWAASDESGRTAWKTYTYSGVAAASNGGPDGQWNEFNMGMMGNGEIWIDDLSVIENPAGAATQKIADPGFNTAAAWRLRGNHRASQVVAEPGNAANKILRIVATGPTEHSHNQVETTLASAIVNGNTYQISFRARWVGGANQLHTRCFFNRLAKMNVIDRVGNPGTPGAVNSRSVANMGPTFTGLKHSPPVPPVNAVATVSCVAEDPDNISAMALFYSVNGGAFNSAAMFTTGGGLYTGSIPGQAAGAVVQFYIRGTDALGANEFYPAAGPNSRALYKVEDGAAATNGLHNFRVITTNADRDWMHTPINVMSNDRIECTIIDRENDIYYGAGVRLKSSERGRNDLVRVGYNIDFPSDALFRGALSGVAVDRSEGTSSGQREILFDVMISNSNGPISRYNDLVKILAPNSTLNRAAVLQLARYDDTFLDEQFENGGAGRLYEYELVYYPTTADASGNKLPYPSPDSVVGVNIQDHGSDPERYRWHFLNKINREADDFAPIMNYCKIFSTSGAQFETLLAERVELDLWFRSMAYAVLSGAGDNNAAGDAHNGIYYAFPNGKVSFFPHDMDFSFDATRSIVANAQCALLTTNPARRRQFYGHLHDIITTTYNNSYMSTWTSHFATLDSSQPWASHLSYMTNRSNNVLSQMTGGIVNVANSAIPNVAFGITTASPLTVNTATATVNGNGWVNVRNIRVQGSAEPLSVTWTGNSTWQITLPAAPGANTIILEAVNFSGAVIGTASITINNTTPVQPASAANLVVSEIMYHPADPSPSEILAGFPDQDLFEFIELQNISAAIVDMTGVKFTGGIDYDFAAGVTIQPGARLVIAANRSAFLVRYPAAAASLAAGSFLNLSQLSNGGESITITNALGGTLRTFAYDDSAPWPVAADGPGFSLVLINPASNPDHSIAANWRASAAAGGNPGTSDAVLFTGDPAADNDGDGISALVEYAFGTSDSAKNSPTDYIMPNGTDAPILTGTPRPGADSVTVQLQASDDLAAWTTVAGPNPNRKFWRWLVTLRP